MSTTDGQREDDGGSSEISVIIPHLNDLGRLRLCLELLQCQTQPRDTFEIIVADNGSSCGIETVVTAVEGLALVVPAPVPGAGPARNAGVARANGKILAFIDADCRPDPDWLERGVAALSLADIVGGRVIVTARNSEQPTPVEAYEIVFAFRTDRYVRARRFVSSCSLFTSAKTFGTVGGFRSEMSEDVDWCWRAQERGFSIAYDPLVVIRHPARHTWAELTSKTDRITREMYFLARSRGVKAWRLALRAALIFLSPMLHVWLVLANPQIGSYRTRFGAALVLFRLRARRAMQMIRLASESLPLR